MARNVDESLTLLENSRSDIVTSLNKKGSNVSTSLKISEVAGKIDGITTKGATIIVTAPDFEGETLTATKGSKSFTGVVRSGTAEITVDESGTWTVSSTSGDKVEVSVSVGFPIELSSKKIYTVVVDNAEADPYKRCTYRDSALGMTPASMGSTFNWGDWKDIFFNKENHVYRVSGNGTAFKQVKDDDYSQFLDGSNSGINSTSGDYNFMASIPTCWVWRRMEGNKAVISISNKQIDNNYKAYAHTAENGNILDFIYWPVFRGSLVSNKLRSISGQDLITNKLVNEEITYATANGSNWYNFDWADYNLRNDLLTLMFKTTNLQKALGQGKVTGNIQDLKTGVLNNKGAFWGDLDTTTSQVKAFHCEAPWGHQYLRISGCNSDGSNVKVKMTRPYNSSGTNYTVLSPAFPGNNKYYGFWSQRNTNEFGTWPTELAGNDANYESDYCENSASSNALVGGTPGNGLNAGPFSISFIYFAADRYPYIGTSLSLKSQTNHLTNPA